MFKRKSKYIAAYIIACILILLAGVTLLNNVNSNENMSYKSIDEYVERQMKDGNIPGLSIAVVKGDKIMYMKGYGIADNSKRKVTPQTPFLINSISKSFCGLAIRQLINEGKIEPDAPVQKYISWFHLADESASKKITIQNLLDHKSGISTMAGNQYYLDSEKYTRKQLIESFSKLKINRPVGTTYEYSNINFIILGQVVEEVSGMSYESYIQKYIFNPLQMNNTFYSQSEARKNGLSEGYQLIFGFPVVTHPSYPNSLSSVGMICSSAEDMGKYVTTFLNGGIYNGYNITTRDGHTPSDMVGNPLIYYDAYWNIYKGSLPNGYAGHSGGSANFNSVLIALPYKEQDTGIVVLDNTRILPILNTFSQTVLGADTIGWGILKNFYFPDNIKMNSSPLNTKLFYFIYDFILLQLVIFTVICAAGTVVWIKKMKQSRKPEFKSIALWAVIEFILPAAIIILLLLKCQYWSTLIQTLVGSPDFILTIPVLSIALIILFVIKLIYMLYVLILNNKKGCRVTNMSIK